MLTSKNQYLASMRAVSDLKKYLELETNPALSKEFVDANKELILKKIQKIENDIAEYESLLNSDPAEIKVETLEDLLEAPIKYRISKKETIKEFSKQVGISQRQLLRYEEQSYKNCSIGNLLLILEKIGLKISGHFSV